MSADNADMHRQHSFAERLVVMLLDHPADRISESAIKATLLCMQDTIGVALASASLGVASAGATVARGLGAEDVAAVWGFGRGSTPHDAALANGMFAHGLDFDDVHPAAIIHASAVNVPVALAMGEALGKSPREIIAAASLGYEVSARLGRLGPGRFMDRGFQSTAVLGVFASAFIAARLTGASTDTAIHAMGVAGSMASGLMEYLSDGSDVKQMQPGWAAHCGIRALALAAAGLTGPRTVLEGRSGIFRSFAGLEIDPETVLHPISDRFAVEEMAPKPYPACMCLHPLVQGALALRERGVISPERIGDIAEIQCEVPEWYVNLILEPKVQKRKPRNAYEGRFSAPFSIARMILDGKFDVRSFTTEKLSDPRMLEIAGKVTYRARDFAEFPESFPALVRVRLASGDIHETFVPHNLGSRRLPLGADGITAKFRDNLELGLARPAADRLEEAIVSFSRAGHAGKLWKALRAATVQQ